MNNTLAYHEQLSCELLITTSCNLACTYCIASELEKMTMDINCGISAIDMFISLAEGASDLEFTFTGGEPLLRLEILKDLVRYADTKSRNAGMNPSFIVKTNGTILNDEIIAIYKTYKFKVVVSIDGLPEFHDKYRKTINGNDTQRIISENIANLLKNEISCVASLSVHPSHASYIIKNIQHLYNLGIKSIDVGPVYGTFSWSESEIIEFAKSLKECAKFMREVNEHDFVEIGPIYQHSEHVHERLRDNWGCKAGATNLAFLPNGKISGCSALAMISPNFPNLVIGDIKTGINDIALQNLFSYSQAHIENRTSCKSCDTGTNCSGGCVAINLSVNSVPLNPPEFYCKTISLLPNVCREAWGDKAT
jgi:uncharacterized protein